ncbi:MAG: RsmG family class I SAM-dependent methyltransferase [Ilumatobacteraceae bacterium]
MPHRSASDEPLRSALRSSQRLGLLGREPVERTIEHADAFVAAVASVHGRVVDLGSGGGVPGLVIAWRRPDLDVVLSERRQARADHLRRLVRSLGLSDRVEVAAGDVADLSAGAFDAVVARRFGPPTATLRAAARLLVDRGRLVVSEPPHPDSQRWATEELRCCGMRPVMHGDRRVFLAERTFHVKQLPTEVADVSRGTDNA